MSNKPNILIIDDDIQILDLFEIYLYKEFTVHTAENGADGIKKAREILPKCIITDILMPVMDGIKFLSRCKKSKELSGIPVIAMTAHNTVLQEQSLEPLGFNRVLIKPISHKMLLNNIKEVLDNNG